jgi:hypothetical protein
MAYNQKKQEYCDRLKTKISKTNTDAPIFEYIKIIQQIDNSNTNIIKDNKDKLKKAVAECLVGITNKSSNSKNNKSFNINNLNKLTELFLQYFETSEPSTNQEKKIFKLMIDVIFEIVIKLDKLSKDLVELEQEKLHKILESFFDQKNKKTNTQKQTSSFANPLPWSTGTRFGQGIRGRRWQ